MNKRIKVILIFLAFGILISLSNICYGRSYSIDDIDMQITVKDDGSVDVNQKMTYTFHGEYNGVYVTIPYLLDDKEYDEFRTQSELNDSLYNNTGAVVNKISSNNVEFNIRNLANIGDKNVYQVTKEDGFMNVKIFSPSANETKVFEIDYTLNNLCVKHNDVGELYYNFIGGNWDENIKKLNIDVYLDDNNSNLQIKWHYSTSID